MRLAILANSKNSFPRIMAEGLQRMLNQIGVSSTIFYNGLDVIRHRELRNSEVSFYDLAKEKFGDWRLRSYVGSWAGYSALIIVGHNPMAFMTGFWNDEKLRGYLPNIPIILYDLVYLGTRSEWNRWLRDGNPALGVPTGGNFGLERYDWYLCASVVSEEALPRRKHPVSVVGLNLDDGSLRAGEQIDFVAVLDFSRDAHLEERQIQIEALQAAEVKWIELTGSYSISDIRAIYRKCSVYCIAHRESFGLPICELQACGAAVFTPYADWCPSHWMKRDLAVAGPGELSENFIVYNNDPAVLVTKLRELKRSYSPIQTRLTLLKRQPELYYGNLIEIGNFVRLLAEGHIHANLHREHSEARVTNYNPN